MVFNLFDGLCLIPMGHPPLFLVVVGRTIGNLTVPEIIRFKSRLTTKSSQMKLDNVRLLVNKFDECFRFYKDVMGFKVTWGKEGEGYASFDAGAIGLAIFQRGVMAADIGTTGLPSDAECQDKSALIFSVDSVDATVKSLEARGARFVTRPKTYPDYGTRSAHLRDPDGNLIEVYSQLPRTDWSRELREEGERPA